MFSITSKILKKWIHQINCPQFKKEVTEEESEEHFVHLYEAVLKVYKSLSMGERELMNNLGIQFLRKKKNLFNDNDFRAFMHSFAGRWKEIESGLEMTSLLSKGEAKIQFNSKCWKNAFFLGIIHTVADRFQTQISVKEGSDDIQHYFEIHWVEAEETSPSHYGLSPKILDAVFPFHFIIDSSLKFVQIGRSLKKLINIREKSRFDTFFSMDTPQVPLEFGQLKNISGPVLLGPKIEGMRYELYGEFFAESEMIYFVGCLTEFCSKQPFNLTKDDFSILDPFKEGFLHPCNDDLAKEEWPCNDDLTTPVSKKNPLLKWMKYGKKDKTVKSKARKSMKPTRSVPSFDKHFDPHHVDELPSDATEATLVEGGSLPGTETNTPHTPSPSITSRRGSRINSSKTSSPRSTTMPMTTPSNTPLTVKRPMEVRSPPEHNFSDPNLKVHLKHDEFFKSLKEPKAELKEGPKTTRKKSKSLTKEEILRNKKRLSATTCSRSPTKSKRKSSLDSIKTHSYDKISPKNAKFKKTTRKDSIRTTGQSLSTPNHRLARVKASSSEATLPPDVLEVTDLYTDAEPDKGNLKSSKIEEIDSKSYEEENNTQDVEKIKISDSMVERMMEQEVTAEKSLKIHYLLFEDISLSLKLLESKSEDTIDIFSALFQFYSINGRQREFVRQLFYKEWKKCPSIFGGDDKMIEDMCSELITPQITTTVEAVWNSIFSELSMMHYDELLRFKICQIFGKLLKRLKDHVEEINPSNPLRQILSAIYLSTHSYFPCLKLFVSKCLIPPLSIPPKNQLDNVYGRKLLTEMLTKLSYYCTLQKVDYFTDDNKLLNQEINEENAQILMQLVRFLSTPSPN